MMIKAIKAVLISSIIAIALIIIHAMLARPGVVALGATAVLNQGMGACNEFIINFSRPVTGVLVYYQFSFSVPAQVLSTLIHGNYTEVIAELPWPYYVVPGEPVVIRGFINEDGSYEFTNAVSTWCPGTGAFMVDPGLNISWVNPLLGVEVPLGWSVSPSGPGFSISVCHNGTEVITRSASVVLGNSFLSNAVYTVYVSSTCNVTIKYLGNVYVVKDGTVTVSAEPGTVIFIIVPSDCRALVTGW